jgi:excisionase family DNA binding protein
MEDEELLTPAECWAIVKCKKSKFYKILAQGKLRAVKSGRLTRVRRKDLEEWLRGLPAYQPRTKR